MTDEPIFKLADLTQQAHTKIQQDFSTIDPVVGISRSMRQSGIPADAMTIDCLKSGKRIIIIVHDEQPDILRYQFSYKASDPGSDFEVVELQDVSAQTLYDWMSDYFSQRTSD
ncbi:MAG: hypothetical protein AseanaTS_26760 [Candidatus Pelagadaptatus aseana]|uniref:hypothetical protein n=1 Tax=Candidatus Pelagadaptatus aseana TaxID=3120508 RepID=UPI0039B19252